MPRQQFTGETKWSFFASRCCLLLLFMLPLIKSISRKWKKSENEGCYLDTVKSNSSSSLHLALATDQWEPNCKLCSYSIGTPNNINKSTQKANSSKKYWQCVNKETMKWRCGAQNEATLECSYTEKEKKAKKSGHLWQGDASKHLKQQTIQLHCLSVCWFLLYKR